MKNVFSLLLAMSCLNFYCNPGQKPNWVWDLEGDLSIDQINQLDSLYASHEKKTTNEIVLVTISDFGSDSSIELYSNHFFEKHKIGKKKVNNGVVMVFSQAQRKTRIATGLGTEKILKDSIAKRIIDSIMIPHFKKADYFEGIWEGSKVIIAFLEKPENKIPGTR